MIHWFVLLFGSSHPELYKNFSQNFPWQSWQQAGITRELSKSSSRGEGMSYWTDGGPHVEQAQVGK